ncbi:MFS transporter [Clostridium sp. MT-14]|uniref:MFS transporter n=1 Tax=Clostridium sp. MT-14 TaxID=3348360 RepID=UPI0035F2C15F
MNGSNTITNNNQPLDSGHKQTRQRYFIAFILFITLLVAFIDRINVSVLIVDPQFLNAMGISGKPLQQGLLMTFFLIAYGISNAVLGPVGDYIGPRKAMCLSLAMWGISMVLGGLATAFGVLLLTRVVLGLGEGLHWPMQSKFVKNWFPPQERAKANSIWILGLFIGPAIGTPFFTWLLSRTPWKTSFYLLAVVSLIPLLLVWFFTTDHPSQSKKVNKEELDWIETGLKAEEAEENKQGNVTIKTSIKSFIKDYHFWLVTIYYTCQCCIWWGTMTWLPSYLKTARGFSWASMGAWSSSPYILGAILLIISGRISDKVGRRAPFPLLAMVIVAICIFGAAYAESNIIAAILLTIAIGSLAIASTAIWSLLQQIVPGKAVGAGAGITNGVANGGSALAPSIMGYFIALSGSYVTGLLFLVIMAVIGGICVGILTLQKY